MHTPKLGVLIFISRGLISQMIRQRNYLSTGNNNDVHSNARMTGKRKILSRTVLHCTLKIAFTLTMILHGIRWDHFTDAERFGFGRVASCAFVQHSGSSNTEDFFSQFRHNADNLWPTSHSSSQSIFSLPPLFGNSAKFGGPSCYRSSMVLMGQKGGSKGDRQNRKPKKPNGAGASAPTPSPAPAGPPRVTNQINVPIKRQIRYGKINKQLREAANSGTSFRQTRKGNFVPVVGGGGGGPVKRTSYRKKLDEETIQQKALERQRKGQNPDWSVILNQTKADPLVLVDGYNVIYKWPRLKKHMTRGDTQHARELLMEDLEGLASLRRWRIECVFDGAGRASIQGPLGNGPGNQQHQDIGKNPTTTPFGKTGTVRTVFTGSGVEADTYIEGRCMAAKNVTLGKITNSLIVATDDAQIKLVANSAGALCMSSDRFVTELKAVKKGMQYRVEKAMAEVNNAQIRPEKMWGSSPSGNFFEASSGDPNSYRSRPKREVLEENDDGSKVIKARYGANEIIIKDNRNKKPRKNPMADGGPKKKKKKRKRNNLYASIVQTTHCASDLKFRKKNRINETYASSPTAILEKSIQPPIPNYS